MIKQFNINLDIDKHIGNHQFNISQNDLNIIELDIIIKKSGLAFDLTNLVPRLAILKPSGLTVFQDLIIVNALNGTIKLTLSTQGYSEFGVHFGEVYIYDNNNNQVAVTGKFSYNSIDSIMSDATIESTNDWQSINTLIDELESQINTQGYSKTQTDSLLSLKADKTYINSVNVIDFGAKGDGIANDTLSIQNTIDYARTNQLKVIIPKGKYILTDTLYVYANSNLQINKNAELFRNHTKSMLQNGKFGDNFTLYNGNGNITIDGGTWNVNGTLLHHDGSAFAIAHGSGITLKNITVLDVYYSHGMEICANENVTITNCTFNGFSDDGTRGFAEAIQLECATSSGFPYFGSADNTINKNVVITDCIFTGWGVGIGSHNSTSLNADGVIIERNIVNLAKTVGMTLTFFNNVTVRDNNVTGTTNAISVTSTNRVYIVNNVLKSTNSDTLLVKTNNLYTDIHNNSIIGTGRHGFNIYDNSRHCKITMNTLNGIVNIAFSLLGATTGIIHIKGNTVVNTSLVNVLNASAGVDHLYFNDNYYSASIGTPIVSSAVSSDTTGNKTF